MMASLLMYSLKSAFVLSLLYVPYVLMLRHESFFRFNRAVLLAILLLSLVLPLCNVAWLSIDDQPVVHAAQMQLIELGVPIETVLPEVEVMEQMQVNAAEWTLFSVVSLIYIIGMACVLATRVWQLSRLSWSVKRGSLWHEERDGVHVFCHAGEVSPFSWMRNIVISAHDYEENGREILLHEMSHIRAHHSWDVLLLTLVEMVQWWNPLTYMLGISLRDVHEYEADDFVLRQGVSAQGYQLLVIKKAVGSGSYAFANSFNHSLTKKRITMMCKKSKSNAWMRSKALYVIPAAALALSVFATPKIVSPVEGAVNNLAGKGTENSLNQQAMENNLSSESQRQRLSLDELKELGFESMEQALSSQVASAPEDTVVYDKPAKNAEYPGGWDACYKFLSESMHYPQLCKEFEVQGRVILKFVVEKDGRITNVEKVRGAGRRLTQADVDDYKQKNPESNLQPKAGDDLGQLLYEEGKRVVESMPRWEPARNEEGDAVRCHFHLPFMFRLN